MRGVVVALIILAGQRAHAEAPEPDEAVASYRTTTLKPDGVALGLAVAGIATSESSLGFLGAGTYAVGAPLVHLTKQRYGRALASVALRVGLPLLGVLIGDSIPRDCPAGDCMTGSRAVGIGFGAGVVTAIALDTIFLAQGDPPPRRPQTAWSPVAAPTRGGLALGVAGEF
jgi:hypothetical protein